MSKIVIGVCSSISIYKACEIVRGLQKESFKVQVIMTENATHLVSPILFSALTGRRVLVNLFQQEKWEEISHVELAKQASVLLVAPATANILGKFASGVADDFLSTFYLAFNGPVVVAPAMNEVMYLHKQSQMNVKKLKSQGVCVVEPEKGYLACQDEGWGRLAPVEKILEQAFKLIRKSQSLQGKTVLVTAGPTREHLDPVRFLSNPSSGKMGFELAGEALRRGAEVILVSGPTHLLPPSGVRTKWIRTAEEMGKEVERHLPKSDIIIMAAAVSDFRFSSSSTQKIRKQKVPRTIRLVETTDILKKAARKKAGKFLVGFAAETENIQENALQKLKEKKLDLIVANDVSKNDMGFGSDDNRVWLCFSDGRILGSGKKSKFEISQMILDEIEGKIGRKS
jgi:phosphopantothenoylcysteine decarboxylase/phosphopantothenate--cysteine ligase